MCSRLQGLNRHQLAAGKARCQSYLDGFQISHSRLIRPPQHVKSLALVEGYACILNVTPSQSIRIWPSGSLTAQLPATCFVQA